MYDAHNPAPGVTVYPMPRAKVDGLTMAQQRASRVCSMNGHVLGAKPIGGPVGLGMKSTANISRIASPIHATTKGCAPGTVRPGSKRRSPKMRTHSLCHKLGSFVKLHVQYEAAKKIKHQELLAIEVPKVIERAKQAAQRGHNDTLATCIERLAKISPDSLRPVCEYAQSCGYDMPRWRVNHVINNIMKGL